jgi:hypothetical protein
MCKTLGTNWEATAKQAIGDKLEAWKAIARVRELHSEVQWAEKAPFCDYDNNLYPCPTIKALDGEQ